MPYTYSDPTQKTIHEEPHDDHWGTWNDKIYICGAELKKGIGISDGCITIVKTIPKWLEAEKEIERLNEAVRELVEELHTQHNQSDNCGCTLYPTTNCHALELILKYTPKEQKKVSVERPIDMEEGQ